MLDHQRLQRREDAVVGVETVAAVVLVNEAVARGLNAVLHLTPAGQRRGHIYIYILHFHIHYLCNGAEWSKDKTQAAESIKWRPQQAYGSNQFLLVQPQTVFSTHPKSSRSRIDKRTARATGNTRYRYSKIAPLDHKMADNCVSLARTNTLSSTITKLIKTSKTSNKSYSYHLLNRINKMYTHDLFYLQQEWEAWLAPVYIQIRTTKSQLTQCTKYKCH